MANMTSLTDAERWNRGGLNLGGKTLAVRLKLAGLIVSGADHSRICIAMLQSSKASIRSQMREIPR